MICTQIFIISLVLYSYSPSFILEVFSKELPIGTFFEIYWQQILIVLHLKMSFFHLHIWAIILLDIKIGVAVLFNTFKMVCHFLLPSVVYDEKSSHSNYCTPLRKCILSLTTSNIFCAFIFIVFWLWCIWTWILFILFDSHQTS